jgi:2-polyprenyl-6-methoxyphenol hydroxylase-like FAD-dependent oxidoreductase
MDADVIIAGAGPTGLMLAAELRLAGVRPLVLERRPRPRDTPKAGGLGGQILDLLRHRGLLGRFEAACTAPVPAPRFPFGGVHLAFNGPYGYEDSKSKGYLSFDGLHPNNTGHRVIAGELQKLGYAPLR